MCESIIVYYYFDRTRLFWPNAQCHLQGLNKLFFHLMCALCFCIIMMSYLKFFWCILLIRNHTIFSRNLEALVNFFQRPRIARARSAILLVFEKIYSCLFIPNFTRNHLITYTNNTVSRHIHDQEITLFFSILARLTPLPSKGLCV